MDFIEREALDYYAIQERQKKLLAELEQKNPSLFKRMMKAGLLAILGAIGAGIIDQDPLKGAAAGAAISLLFQKKQLSPRPQQTPQLFRE